MHPQQLLGHLQYLTAKGGIPVATLMRSYCYASQACLHCLNDGSQCTDNNCLGNGCQGKNFPEGHPLFEIPLLCHISDIMYKEKN